MGSNKWQYRSTRRETVTTTVRLTPSRTSIPTNSVAKDLGDVRAQCRGSSFSSHGSPNHQPPGILEDLHLEHTHKQTDGKIPG